MRPACCWWSSRLRAGYAPVLIGSLGFLGFGLRPPTPEWGLMISENRALIIITPITVLGPGLALASLVVGLNLFTEGLARILGRTVRLRQRRMTPDTVLEVRNLSVAYRQGGGWSRAVDDVQLRPEEGRGLRPGRRIRLRQVHGLAATARLSPSVDAGRRRTGPVQATRTCWLSTRPQLDKLRGEKIAFVPQNPTTALNPGIRIGRQVAETMVAHGRAEGSRRRRSGGRQVSEAGRPAHRSRIPAGAIRISSPAASSSASASPWRCAAIPICWCWTSRPPASTSPPRSRSSPC